VIRSVVKHSIRHTNKVVALIEGAVRIEELVEPRVTSCPGIEQVIDQVDNNFVSPLDKISRPLTD
jgi:hypothetical protein